MKEKTKYTEPLSFKASLTTVMLIASLENEGLKRCVILEKSIDMFYSDYCRKNNIPIAPGNTE